MSSKLYHVVHIHDVQSCNFTQNDIFILLDILSNILKKSSAMLAIEARFDLKDFSIIKFSHHNHLAELSLHIQRTSYPTQEQWTGHFHSPTQSLKILASLEPL
jgi:hypothetical protein